MDKKSLEKICELKVNAMKAKCNLRIEEQEYYTSELNKILSKLTLTEVRDVEEYVATALVKTTKALKEYSKILNIMVKNKQQTTTFDAKNFYDLRSKKLAYKDLLDECHEIDERLTEEFMHNVRGL